MFDIGWQELFVIAAVTIVVIGPKELPRTLRAIYGLVRKGRMMAREFQDGLDEVVRQADLEDIKAELERTRKELKATEDRMSEGSRDLLDTLDREHDELKTILGPEAPAEHPLPAVTAPAPLPAPVPVAEGRPASPDRPTPPLPLSPAPPLPADPAVGRDGAPADQAAGTDAAAARGQRQAGG